MTEITLYIKVNLDDKITEYRERISEAYDDDLRPFEILVKRCFVDGYLADYEEIVEANGGKPPSEYKLNKLGLSYRKPNARSLSAVELKSAAKEICDNKRAEAGLVNDDDDGESASEVAAEIKRWEERVSDLPSTFAEEYDEAGDQGEPSLEQAIENIIARLRRCGVTGHLVLKI